MGKYFEYAAGEEVSLALSHKEMFFGESRFDREGDARLIWMLRFLFLGDISYSNSFRVNMWDCRFAPMLRDLCIIVWVGIWWMLCSETSF